MKTRCHVRGRERRMRPTRRCGTTLLASAYQKKSTREKTPNAKPQYPKKLEVPNPKGRLPDSPSRCDLRSASGNGRRSHWTLGLGVSLEFGVWSLEFIQGLELGI